ncbi:hypothetical protein BD779DRAFT_1669016 [Infundibulicybe gibba]|nr:hypothetical protein BD779DRAFT_1669016 [Infundibulicybe gibba]
MITILRSYAQRAPSAFPNSVLFSHTTTSLTIFDAYPKSIFHFLVLPRMGDSASEVARLMDLKSLLRSDKAYAKDVITSLLDDAKIVKKEIEAEMLNRYGFVWSIWIGFHALSSMEHLHLHIISADLCSSAMKNKKHYNSFHPKLGFFLHAEEVLSWFDAEPSYYNAMTKLDQGKYEGMLKEGLVCFHCSAEMKNIPTLKNHLQVEWDSWASREKMRMERKKKIERKRARPPPEKGALEEAQLKKHKGIIDN